MGRMMGLILMGVTMAACPQGSYDPTTDTGNAESTGHQTTSSTSVDPTTGTADGTTTNSPTTTTGDEEMMTTGGSGTGGWNENLCQNQWPLNPPDNLPYGTECHECLAKNEAVEQCCWIYEACLATPAQNDDGSYNWEACAFQLMCPNIVYECMEGDGLNTALLFQKCLIEQAGGACTDVCGPNPRDSSL